MHTLLCVCSPRMESLFPQVLLKSCNQILLSLKVWFSRNSSSRVGPPDWEAWCGAQNFHSGGWTSVIWVFSSLWVTHLAVMGFDFIVFESLLQFHCGLSFVFGCGVSFFVCSSVFLLTIFQQLFVILVFLQERIVFVFFCLTYFTKHNTFQVHPYCHNGKIHSV